VSLSTGEDGFSYASHFLTSVQYFSNLLYLEVFILFVAANMLAFCSICGSSFLRFCRKRGILRSCIMKTTNLSCSVSLSFVMFLVKIGS
jgi:hypothetical protein